MTVRLQDTMQYSKEVSSALEEGTPIVALESTLISHGLPYPMNVETALCVESLIRKEGAIPATIAIIEGKIQIGLSSSQLEFIATHKNILKLSRRDLPFALAMKKSGATTVSATMICSQLAGISIFATGGIGGVHREAEKTFDISADIRELANLDVAVVCAGVKSILDIPRTLELLETFGVPIIGYKTDTFPTFYSKESTYSIDYRLDSVEKIAALLDYKWSLGIHGAVLVANPIPKEESLDPKLMEDLIVQALEEAKETGIKGKEVTPFLLSRIVDKSCGKSLKANMALIKNNALIAAQLAKAFSLRKCVTLSL